MRVAQLSRELHVSADTIRYYTRIGLIKPIRNSDNNYKEYSEQDRKRFQFVLNAQTLGFTLGDIKEIIREASKGKMACPMARQILEKRLQETEQHFSQQCAMRRHMKNAMKDWGKKPNQEPSGYEICHLIEGFNESY